MVGTTEVPDTGDPSKTTPSADEIDYLIRTVHSYFPKQSCRHRTLSMHLPACAHCLVRLETSLRR